MSLFGIGLSKLGDSLVQLGTVPAVAGDGRRIARSGMRFCQDLARYQSVFLQRRSSQVLGIDTGLVVVKLAHQIVASLDRGPTKQRIGNRLQAMLSFGHTLPLMMESGDIFQIRRVAGSHCLLYLKE